MRFQGHEHSIIQPLGNCKRGIELTVFVWDPYPEDNWKRNLGEYKRLKLGVVRYMNVQVIKLVCPAKIENYRSGLPLERAPPHKKPVTVKK
jgi:hypothetical protein